MTWLQFWPIYFVCVGMLAAAIIDWWKFKVPNWLTFPLILSGWLLGLLNNFGVVPWGGDGGIVSALVGTVVAGLPLLLMYAIGGMGAGDVKMAMGFGAWVGAFYGFEPHNSVMIILWAFAVGGIVGGIIATVMIVIRGQYQKNAQHVREIFSDMLTAKSVGEVGEKADKRRPRWHRLPYGVPLCIGFLGYLVWYYVTLGG